MKVCLSDAVYEFGQKMKSRSQHYLEKAIDEIDAIPTQEKPHSS